MTLSARTRALLLIVLISVTLRLACALFMGNQLTPLPGIHDQLSYDALATRLLDGHGFSFAENWWPATRANEPTAHWSFLYTFYLAAVYGTVGHYPLVARVLEVLLVGILQPWLTFRIANRLFGVRPGIVSALFCAVYPYFAFYSAALMTEAFYITAVLWTLDSASRIGVSKELPRTPAWLELGFAIGVAALLRQAFLLFTPVLVGCFLWSAWSGVARAHNRLRFSARLLAMLMVPALLILPFTIRNYFAFKQFVPLNTNAGYVLFWANHPVHGTHFIPILKGSGDRYGALIPARLLSLDEASLDKALLRLGLQEIIDDPGRYAALCLSRAVEYFKFWPEETSGALSNWARVLSFGLLAPFALFGLILSPAALGERRSPSGVPRQRTSGQSISLLIVLCFIISYSLIHLLTWTLVRYRLPIDALLVIFASVGVLELAERFTFLRLPGAWPSVRLNHGEQN